jgi:hypothetical protein
MNEMLIVDDTNAAEKQKDVRVKKNGAQSVMNVHGSFQSFFSLQHPQTGSGMHSH